MFVVMTTSTLSVMIDALFKGIETATQQIARILWSALLSFLTAHWFAVLVAIFVIFVVALLKAMLGRWGSLGSFLYNLFYFGILFVIGLIWGSEVFVNNLFNAAVAIILYPICYFITGLILEKTGLRR